MLGKAAPNQKAIRIGPKEPCNKSNLFFQRNLEADKMAMINLKGNLYKVWAYFARNQTDYEFNLSQQAVSNATGIKKDAYLTCINSLIELGYLVPTELYPGFMGYIFYETPLLSEKPTTDIGKTARPLSEKPTTDIGKTVDGKTDSIEIDSAIGKTARPLSENPLVTSGKTACQRAEKPARNYTNNTEYNKDNTGALSDEEKELANQKIDLLLEQDESFKPLISEMKKILDERALFNWVMNR